MKAVRPTATATQAARKAAGFSRQDLAQAVGVSLTAVLHWEHGRTRRLKRQHLQAVAHLLQQTPEWLETGARTDAP